MTSRSVGPSRRGKDDRGATLRRAHGRRRLARMIGRRMISSYLTVNAYAEFHRWLGGQTRCQPMWDAWAEGNRNSRTSLIRLGSSMNDHPGPTRPVANTSFATSSGVQIPTLAIVPFGVDLKEAVEDWRLVRPFGFENPTCPRTSQRAAAVRVGMNSVGLVGV